MLKTIRKIEYSKLLTTVLVAAGIIWITFSYILAYLDKHVNDAVTIAVMAYTLGTAATYMSYQFGLKNSRNKYNEGEPLPEETKGSAFFG